MPRTEAANQQVREAQRAKILETARKVFARKGIGATMTDIATTAEISQGLAYRYFDSKEALYYELVEATAQYGLAVVQRVRAMPGTPGSKLEYVLINLFGNRIEIYEHYQLSFQALNDETTPEALRDLLRRQAEGLQDTMRDLVVEGQATGEIYAGDPDQLLIAILAYFEGISRTALRQNDQPNPHFPDPRIMLRMIKS